MAIMLEEYVEIANKIVELKNADLKMRAYLLKNNKLNEGYNAEMEKLHVDNAKKLNAIIEKIGYPTIGKVGEEASDAAWLIIQHSISNPEFMKRSLQLLKVAVKDKEANPIHFAYLTDRIAVLEGKVQLYGTQFDWDDNGELSPQKFDDLQKVNQRRKAIGLNGLEEQTALIRKRATEENQKPPTDFVKRNMEMKIWRKRVGWI